MFGMIAMLSACASRGEPLSAPSVRREIALAHPVAALTSLAPHPTIVEVTLPVRVCESVSGVEREEPPVVASAATISIRTDLADKVDLYTDTKRWFGPLLGPRGWSCRAVQTANGAREMVLGDPRSTTWRPRGQTPTALIHVTVPSLCCADSEVCSIVPRAYVGFVARQGSDIARASCNAPPDGEVITWFRGTRDMTPSEGDIITFHDPPGVKGAGAGSGGPRPASGVILYKPLPEAMSAFTRKLTCVMPPEESALCDALIDHFIDNW